MYTHGHSVATAQRQAACDAGGKPGKANPISQILPDRYQIWNTYRAELHASSVFMPLYLDWYIHGTAIDLIRNVREVEKDCHLLDDGM